MIKKLKLLQYFPCIINKRTSSGTNIGPKRTISCSSATNARLDSTGSENTTAITRSTIARNYTPAIIVGKHSSKSRHIIYPGTN